jgi:hypothetical protein
MLVLTRATQRNNPEDSILHCFLLFDLFIEAFTGFSLNNVESQHNQQILICKSLSQRNNFVDWPHSGAVMRYSEYNGPRNGATFVPLSSQQEAALRSERKSLL